MNALQTIVVGFGRALLSLTCRVDAPDLEKIPSSGPVILAINHINSLEIPVLVAWLYPRKLIGLAKIETWNNPFMGWLFTLYEAISIHRGEVDLEAIHRCLVALSEGEFLAIAPEGTRSYDGKLQSGQQGIVLLALHSKVPILPVVHWGGEAFSKNFKRLKRTDVHLRVGRPFTLDTRGEKPVGKIRQAMVDEIMNEMAALMPESYRGVYSDCKSSPKKYIQYV
jgi:1-acyl-sn-glycerol-3-phosphate acyltransferase